MSKRSHQDFSEGGEAGRSLGEVSTDQGLARSRKARGRGTGKAVSLGEGAIDILIDNAEELLDCIKTLKCQRERGSLGLQALEPRARENLASLTGRVQPALQILGDQLRQTWGHDAAMRPEQPKMGNPAPESTTAMPLATSSITQWNLSDIPKTTPLLPKVLDPALETAALTHSGMTPGQPSASYERLEWIGDAYLYLISSSLIYQTFKSLPPGRCAQIREILVRNSTLASYSVRYKLDRRVRFPAEFGKQGRQGGTMVTDKERNKVLGDAFEAYVGAIILSDPDHGLVRAAAWLKALWAGTIENNIREEKKKEASQPPASSLETRGANGQTPTPKMRLSSAILIPGVKLRYEDVDRKEEKKPDDKLQRFSVAIFLDGWGETNKELAWASALSKKEAGQLAAQKVLNNKTLIQPYAIKKKEFLAAQQNN